MILLFVILSGLQYINRLPAKYNDSDRGLPMNENKMKPILKILLLFLLAGMIFIHTAGCGGIRRQCGSN